VVVLVAVTLGVVPVPSGAAALPRAAFAGHGSIDEAYALGATVGERLSLLDAAGATVGSGVVSKLGGLIVRNVAPGAGYRFEALGGGHPTASAPFCPRTRPPHRPSTPTSTSWPASTT